MLVGNRTRLSELSDHADNTLLLRLTGLERTVFEDDEPERLHHDRARVRGAGVELSL